MFPRLLRESGNVLLHSPGPFCYENKLSALHSESGGSSCQYLLPELYTLGYSPRLLWLQELILSFPFVMNTARECLAPAVSLAPVAR